MLEKHKALIMWEVSLVSVTVIAEKIPIRNIVTNVIILVLKPMWTHKTFPLKG